VVDTYGPAWCIAVSKNKKMLAVGCEAGNVRMYDLSMGELEYKFSITVPGGSYTLHTSRILCESYSISIGRVLSLAFGQNDDYLIVGNSQSSIVVYDLQTRMREHPF
jgi:U3 small nucleolar RNA-associated protein 4